MASDPNMPSPPIPPVPPVRTSRNQAAGILWLIVGALLLAALLLLWLWPFPPEANPIEWALRLFSNSPSNSGSGYLRRQYGASVLNGPQAFAVILPIALGVLSLAALSSSLQLQRRRAAALVLGHLASAIQLSMPLSMYLRSAARGEQRLPRKRLLQLASDLDAGDSISGALADAAGELPPLVLDRVAAAEQSFSLTHALGDILERERRRTAEPAPGVPSRAYAAIVLATMTLVTWLILIFVMPKFAQIFADFKLKLPNVTLVLIGDFPVLLSTLILLAAAISLLVLLSRITRMLFTARTAPDLLGWATDPIQWFTPIYGRLTRNRQMALVCEALAEALIAGRPMPEAIGIATLPSMNRVLRKKLRAWRAGVEDGAPLTSAARSAGVPRLLCDVLAGTTADDGSGAVSAVVFAGRAYNGASGRLAAVLSAIAPIVLTGILAAFVAFLALAMFMPMISLIDGMTGATRVR
ncbi:MAG: type secretion system family protein [Phycisphaerales bacterium]|nr:type secretion system family protein [Phycisphaerales bacterium]